jgi:antitoxin MazE
MGRVLKTKLVRIGNSRGIRLPTVWIKELELGEEVEMVVEADRLVVRSARRPREGWDEAFREMADRGEDRLLEGVVATQWDGDEWQW